MARQTTRLPCPAGGPRGAEAGEAPPQRKGMTMTMVTGTDLLAPDQDPDGDGRDEAAVAELAVVKPTNVRECLADDTGATTAEYAITTLAACGFAALLVIVLKSDPLKEMITGVITGALGLGGA